MWNYPNLNIRYKIGDINVFKFSDQLFYSHLNSTVQQIKDFFICFPWRATLSEYSQNKNKQKIIHYTPFTIPLYLKMEIHLKSPIWWSFFTFFKFFRNSIFFILVKDITTTSVRFNRLYRTIFKENIVSRKPLEKSRISLRTLWCFDRPRPRESNMIWNNGKSAMRVGN